MHMPDFYAITERIRNNGGFELERLASPYVLPNTPPHDGSEPKTRFFRNGSAEILLHNVDLPQPTIDEHRKWYARNLADYMNPADVAAFMCNYYRSGRFLDDPNYLQILAQPLRQPEDHRTASAKASHMGYTDDQLKDVNRLAQAFPDFKKTVAAYQAGFVAYLEELGRHVTIDVQDQLSPSQQEVGMKLIENFRKEWLGTNRFVYEVLPALYLAYQERQPLQILPPDATDIAKGMELAIPMGLYTSFITGPKGDIKEFVCAAAPTINKTDAIGAAGEICNHQSHSNDTTTMLSLIFSVLQKQRIEPEPANRCPYGAVIFGAATAA